MQTVRIFSNDMRMQFGILKCVMLEMERGKVVQSDGAILPSGETIKSLENEKGYKYMGILQFDSVKSKEMKDSITYEYYLKIRKNLKASLNVGNTIQAINARAVSIIRYRAGITE